MADDQVKYSDLIADDVVKGLEVLNQALKDIKATMAGVKEEAASLGVSLKNVSTATREQQQTTAQNAASVDGLSKKVKQLTEEERMLESVRRQYKKLTDGQIARVDRLAVSLSRMNTADQSTVDHALKLINIINIENKSYNELQATYNVLMNTIKNMNTEQLRSSQIGKTMVATAKNIRETMNETQKSVGNYTLQVGKYKAAFDGLGFSFMQILREAPSALNLNQFILAISNNLPLFFDQIDRFKTEQKEIKQTLADLAAQGKQTSDEYIKIAKQQTTVFKRLTSAIFSMQGAVLVFTLILRFLPKIVDWFKKVFNSTNDLSNGMRTLKSVVLDIDKAVISAENDTVAALRMINERIKDLKPGTNDYVTAVRMVNELTKSTLDETKAMPAEVEKVTAAYIEMQRKLAENAELQRLISRSNAGKAIRDIVMDRNAGSAADRAAMIGGENQGRIQELLEYFEKYKPIEEMNLWDFIKANIGYGGSFNGGMLGKASELDRLINQSLGIFDEDVEKRIRQRFNIIATQEEPKKRGSTKEPKDEVADLLTLQRQLDDAIIANIEDEFEREEAAEIARHNRFVEDKQKELELVKGDAERTAVINQQIAEEQNTHDRNMLDIDEKYRQQIIKRIEEQKKAEEQAAKEAERLAKEKIQQEEKDFKAHQEIDKRRFELTKHTAKEERKFVMQQQIEFLQWRIKNAKALGISPELLEVMKQEYAQMQEMFNKGIYSTGKKNTYSSGMEVIADVLGFDIDSNQISAINSVFDQAKEALNSWMDARKAAADQAKELADDEVSAAENALNREIELRNQGYANDVALRERELADAKEKQKKALEEQNKIAKEQILLDAAMQTSSLITASANIIKQFPNPLAWVPMLATMWGAFGYAKIKAYQASTKSITFGEGGSMLLEGGSHQSGHDVNLGIGPDGSNLRAEGGEYFAVINKRNSRKYGSEIPAVVNALNSGMFEDRYIKTSDAVGLLPRIIRADDGSTVDLSAVESGVGQLVKQGERSWSTEGEYRVMRYKNLTRRVKIS